MKFSALALGVCGMAVSRATLPVFSNVAAKEDDDLLNLAKRWAKIMLFAGLVVGGSIWLAGPTIVRLVLERGAFTSSDTVTVSWLLRLSLVQLPLVMYTMPIISFFGSKRNYLVLCLSGVIGLVTKIISASILVKYFGLEGLVISMGCAVLGSSIFLHSSISRKG